MNSAGHHSMMEQAGGSPSTKTWDYRVAYFQCTETAGRSHGYFVLPSASELNPACGVSAAAAQSSFLDAPHRQESVIVGYAPGTTGLNYDRKDVGVGYQWYALFIYQSKWRPARSPGGWPTQPTSSQFPLVAGKVVSCNFFYEDSNPVRCGYTMRDGSGREHTWLLSNYTKPEPGSWTTANNTKLSVVVFGYSTTTGSIINDIRIHETVKGFRFFQSTVSNDHPTLGWSANWIPVVKKGQLYIANTLTGILYPKLGGSVDIGPEVADDFDPMTWTDS